MRNVARSLGAWLGIALLGGGLPAQGPTYAAATAAEAGPLATEPGGFLLAIPGVADDFVLFADGQFETRANGTARLSGLLRRQSAFDRELFVVLEFSGRIDPGSPLHPPAGAPILTMDPAAYVPLGPVDPLTFVHYTQVTGTITGLHSYLGAAIAVSAAAPVQVGTGANNENLQPGLLADLTLQVVQPPVLLPFVPTGAARLRSNLLPSLPHCASHVDPDAAVAPTAVRACLAVPGVATDFVFLPTGEWTEAADGSATLRGTLRRQSAHPESWVLDLTFTGRLDPGAAAFPPTGSPGLALDPSAYVPQGPVDPALWRYYTTALGTLTGDGANAGGLVHLVNSGPLQVGLGADGGNLCFGIAGALVATVASQPTAGSFSPTGNLQLVANVGTECILPPLQVLTGTNQTLPNVTELRAVYTGIDLGFCEQVAVGTKILAFQDPRRWFGGHFRIVDHQTIELAVPQGLVPGNYPVRLLGRGASSAQMNLVLQPPAVPTLRSEASILPGEDQHWLVHQGNLVGPVLSYVVLSGSHAPSVLPGMISLQIGNQFQETMMFTGLLHDANGLLSVTIPAMPPVFLGQRIWQQAAMIELFNPNVLPLSTSDVWATDY